MIVTERLLLRPYALTDFAPYHAMTSDPAVARFIGGEPLSAEDAWNRLLRYAGHWSLLGYGLFAVLVRDSGEYVGETGLADFHRGLGERMDGADEAAWVFRREAQGHGYGTEAALAAHRWYDKERGRRRTVCLIHPDNLASMKLAARLGYRRFGDCTYRGQPAVMLERLPS